MHQPSGLEPAYVDLNGARLVRKIVNRQDRGVLERQMMREDRRLVRLDDRQRAAAKFRALFAHPDAALDKVQQRVRIPPLRSP